MNCVYCVCYVPNKQKNFLHFLNANLFGEILYEDPLDILSVVFIVGPDKVWRKYKKNISEN